MWSPINLALGAILASALSAGPVEFGLRELRQAAAERKLAPRLTPTYTEVSVFVKADSFELSPARVLGGDVRGVMYGLLEAADQLRRTGRIAPTKQAATTLIRGVHLQLTPADWARPQSVWQEFFERLAKARLNRVHITLPPGRETQLQILAQLAADVAVDIAVDPDPSISVTDLLRRIPEIRTIVTTAPQPNLLEDIRSIGRLITLESPAPRPAETAWRTIRPFPPGIAFPDPSTLTTTGGPFLHRIQPPTTADPVFIRLAAQAATLFAEGVEISVPLDFPHFLPWGRLLFQPTEKFDPAPQLYARHWFESIPDAVHRLHYQSSLDPKNSGSNPARFEGRRLWAGYLHQLYDRTRHDTALQAARREYAGALRLAEQLKTPAPELTIRLATLDIATPSESPTPLEWPLDPPRPTLTHKPFLMTFAAKPLAVPAYLSSAKDVQNIRLHYRLLADTGAFRTLETPARAPRLLIPAADLRPGTLIYYFELTHASGSWIYPELHLTKVEVEKKAEPPK